MSPMIYYETVKIRHKDLLLEAEQERLAKLALMDQPSLGDRVQIGLARLLVDVGGRLQKRPAPNNWAV